ncbi:MAG: hypothetical protein FWD61_16495 [Phycisphaerales bacterium]|nr:hypothetical protein [Phycisphaerales bacterium]
MKMRRLGPCCFFFMTIGMAGMAWAEDGELFPNVKAYDEQVQAPVSKPEQTLEKLKPVQTPKPPVVGPEVAKELPKEPAKVEKKATLQWPSYREMLLTPLLSEASQKRFDTEFASKVQTILKSRGKAAWDAADKLWKDAESPGLPTDLKRTLWLHALGLSIRRGADLEARGTMAKAVLPLLVEETLPVAQARADVVTELAYGAISKASDSLLALVAESQSKLAKLQVQGGYPDQAAASIKTAREALKLIKDPTTSTREAVTEAALWVDRASAARTLADLWKQTPASKPADPAANTQMAVLHLSLYGDLDHACTFAAKSDLAELKSLATAITNLRASTGDRAKTLRDFLAVASSLLDIADSSAVQTFDRYSIASLVDARLAALTVSSEWNDEQQTQIKTLTTRAKAIVVKTDIRRPAYSGLAALTGDSAAASSASQPNVSTLQLFVKDNGTVIKYVKPTPKQDAEALTLIRNQAKTIGEKSNIKLTEIETAHCLVYTDWDASEQSFLKKNVEGAYIASAKMFDFPLNESVFPGKLPLYVLAGKNAFLAVGEAMGRTNLTKVIGTFTVNDDGIGSAIMYRKSPDARTSAQDCLGEFGRTLSWQMTNAFIARYRTNKTLTGWLRMGIPARVSYAQFRTENERSAIQKFISKKRTLKEILVDSVSDYESQAVAGTIVEMLQTKDSKAFVAMINKIKDGQDGADALKETYKMTYDDVEKTWNRWIPNR